MANLCLEMIEWELFCQLTQSLPQRAMVEACQCPYSFLSYKSSAFPPNVSELRTLMCTSFPQKLPQTSESHKDRCWGAANFGRASQIQPCFVHPSRLPFGIECLCVSCHVNSTFHKIFSNCLVYQLCSWTKTCASLYMILYIIIILTAFGIHA